MKSNPQDITPDSIRGDILATEHLSGEQIKLIDDARLSRMVAQTQKRFDVVDYQSGVIKGAE